MPTSMLPVGRLRPPPIRPIDFAGTAHAGALTALIETADAYRFYLAVYARNVGRLTPVYMALIDPFRKLIVYPSLLRSIRETWSRAFGT